MTKERKILLGILAVAFLLRLGAGIAGLVITHDGARFTYMARLIDKGAMDEAMKVWPHHPPLYPLLITMLAHLFRDLEIAGIAVSIIFGTLALLPLYALAKSIAGERIAVVASIIYAFSPEPAVYGGEVMSEATFLFFFLSWMALLWSGTREPHWTKFALAGLVAVAAYLTRPEGIYTVIGTLGWCALMARRQWLHLVAGTALFLLVFLIVAWPYLLWVRSATGKWSITASPFASGILDRLSGKTASTAPEWTSDEYKEHRARQKFGRLGGALFSVLRESVKVCFYVFLPLAILGMVLARRRGVGVEGIAYLLLLMGGYTIPTVIAMMADQPFSNRYVLPTWVFAIPFMAIGSLEVLSWLRRWKHVPTVVVILLLGIMVAKTVKPRRGDRLDLKETGLWIRQQGENLRIASMDRRVEHYAQARSVPVPSQYSDLPKDVRFVILYERQIEHVAPTFREDLAKEFREVHRSGNVTVYGSLSSVAP